MDKLTKVALSATLGVALAFTLSCSGEDGGELSYNYCIREDNVCLKGPITASTCNGQVSNSCPNDSNQGGSSSSSSDGNSSLYSSSSSSVASPCNINGYRTVVIGTQTWMAENLNCNVSGSVCYNNNESTCTTYGRLYDWSTAMALPPSCNSTSCSSQIGTKYHRGICPDGWHIPKDDEWNALVTAVGGESSGGSYLKSTSGWTCGGRATDGYGFSALPGGYGFSSGNFFNIGQNGYWWSATSEYEYDNNQVYTLYMNCNEYAGWYHYSKVNLYSVRCVQDESSRVVVPSNSSSSNLGTSTCNSTCASQVETSMGSSLQSSAFCNAVASNCGTACKTNYSWCR